MLEKIIAYFANRHLLSNMIVAAVLVGGVFAWQHTSKEELPDITFDRVRISVAYPGAPAEDVEYFVTKPIEEELRGLDGIYRIESTSSVGSASITVEMERDYPELNEAITEIRNAVLDVDLPSDITEVPNVRVFKTSKKAIIDIALIHRDALILDVDQRRTLQQYALALENQLLKQGAVNSVNKDGYLQPEIQIRADPQLLQRYELPFNQVMQEIRNNNIRQPAGSLETLREPKVTLVSELDSAERLRNLIIQGGFEGRAIRLEEVAEIHDGFEKNQSITSVNGHEAVMFSVVKNSSYGILEALNAVNQTVAAFRRDVLPGSPVELVLLDDESVDIRNRLSLIGFNGTLGFVLILLTLFVFLNKRSGLWVALGIPFSLCATMIMASLLGYTINGTTLAAVIIVMGIIVDDAIVVAENITRRAQSGMPYREAVVKGTAEMILPVIASITTTCVAFVPLFFFTGHFGAFIEHIPPIIFMVLGASLFESMLILPGHMHLEIPLLRRLGRKKSVESQPRAHWFIRVEDAYGRLLERVLPHKGWVFVSFVVLLALASWVVTQRMKFVMFPNEETREIVISGTTDPADTRYDTAAKTQALDRALRPYLGKEVVGYRNDIARSRRGGAVEENKFRMIVEIVDREKRRKSADQIVQEIKAAVDGVTGFTELNFQKSRWGQSSGSAIELIVQQNNDQVRSAIVADLMARMEKDPNLMNVESDGDLRVPEYVVDIDRERIKRLSIDARDIASTLRGALEGTILYEFSNGDEDEAVRFTIHDAAKDDIAKVMALPVENSGDYLVPLRDIVRVEENQAPIAISRRDLRRTTLIDAGLAKGTRQTPLELAERYEAEVFPAIVAKYPTTTLSFGGEVQDTRESQDDLRNAVIMALLLIFVILAVLFNSLSKPLIIMLAIPFGVVGVVLAFWLHGKTLFGFYAAVGALGLAGVVINDSIIMLLKLDRDYDLGTGPEASHRQIAAIAKTRLRAVVLTTLTTVAGVLPTAYGFAGYDAMLAEMMLALSWGMVFGTLITLILIPSVYSLGEDLRFRMNKWRGGT